MWIFRVYTVSQIYPKFPMKMKFWVRSGVRLNPRTLFESAPDDDDDDDNNNNNNNNNKTGQRSLHFLRLFSILNLNNKPPIYFVQTRARYLSKSSLTFKYSPSFNDVFISVF